MPDCYIMSFTAKGSELSLELNRGLSEKGYSCHSYTVEAYAHGENLFAFKGKASDCIKEWFKQGNALIFVGAVGIAVRYIAPFVNNKCSDPCVVCVDEKGQYVIPVLSGHLGGGNEMANVIADIMHRIGRKSSAIITTATDINNEFAVDVYAKKHNFYISDMSLAKRVSANLLNGEKVYIDYDKNFFDKLPESVSTLGSVIEISDIDRIEDKSETGIYISSYDINQKWCENTLFLIPKRIVLGIGCRKNIPYEKLSKYVSDILNEFSIFPQAVCAIASIDLKKNEAGIVNLANEYGCPFVTYSADELNSLDLNALIDKENTLSTSEYVRSVTGVDNVCERSALLYSGAKSLIIKKHSFDGMTIAAAILENDLAKKPRLNTCKVLLFGGTTEARELAHILTQHKTIFTTVSSATEYGSEMLEDIKGNDNITLHYGRMDAKEMKSFINRGYFDYVLDATHPYAVEVSKNIKSAADSENVKYIRVIRPAKELSGNEGEKVIYVNSANEAAEYLKGTSGNILSTIGSKELPLLECIEDCHERIYARILSNPEMLAKCLELGYTGKHLICMHGPFSEELNRAMIKQYDIKYLLTKESGDNGGFDEKVNAALKENAVCIIIKRPHEETEGVSVNQAVDTILSGMCIGSARTEENAVIMPAANSSDLKKGYTTGTCAAIAAKAAAKMLLGSEMIDEESVVTPNGTAITVKIHDVFREDGSVSCAVIKYSGDDPDVTNGTYVYAKVSKVKGSDIEIDGGEGVGRVTKPGLSCKVGEAAINPVPRQMISLAVSEVFESFGYDGGARVVISVPEGIKLAEKTFNPRLGIEGGISILGTTGIVEPMSERALIDTIKVEINVAKAAGLKTLVVVPGNYGADYLRNELNINIDKAVTSSNYLGETLDYAAKQGFDSILLVGHVGKLVKLAAGVFNTHSHVADGRMEIFAAHAAMAGAGSDTCIGIMECVSADEAIRMIKDAGLYDRVEASVSAKIEYHLEHRCPGIRIGALIFSSVHGVVLKTPLADELIESVSQEEN